MGAFLFDRGAFLFDRGAFLIGAKTVPFCEISWRAGRSTSYGNRSNLREKRSTFVLARNQSTFKHCRCLSTHGYTDSPGIISDRRSEKRRS